MNNPEAEFTSWFQYQLIAYSLSRDRSVVGILPTGGGKSMSYELPAMLYPNQTSVVFVPFVAVINDQLRRAREKNIKAAKFKPSVQPAQDLQLLFVSWEHANNKGLLRYVVCYPLFCSC